MSTHAEPVGASAQSDPFCLPQLMTIKEPLAEPPRLGTATPATANRRDTIAGVAAHRKPDAHRAAAAVGRREQAGGVQASLPRRLTRGVRWHENWPPTGRHDCSYLHLQLTVRPRHLAGGAGDHGEHRTGRVDEHREPAHARDVHGGD